MIKIKKSPTADTRTTDVSKVSKSQLLKSSKQHIEDVRKGLVWICAKLMNAANNHDHTKLLLIDMFYKDFKNNFETQLWYDLHKSLLRHHLSVPEGIRDDVDLIDVILFLVDGVMAGLARSGKYRKLDLPEGLLLKAFNNTVDKLIDNILVLE